MGGYVLFRYLARYAGDVKALMFLGTRAEADTAEGRERRFAAIRRIIVEGREGFLDDFLRQMVTSRTSESRPAVVAEVRRLLDSASAEVLTASLQAMADRPDSAPLLPTITLPTSIIVGQEDQVTPADSSRRMHAAIPGSTLVVIPEAGHMCNVEQPERFNAALLGFLGRIT